MKKLIFISSIFLLFNIQTNAQVTVEGVNINALNIKFVQIIGFDRTFFGRNSTIRIDYGQNFRPMKNQIVKGSDGRVQRFTTVIEALNFMEKNGWEFIDSNAVLLNGSSYTTYLFRKKKTTN